MFLDIPMTGLMATMQGSGSNGLNFMTQGVLSPDRVSSALYDAQQSDMVRRSILGYTDAISTRPNCGVNHRCYGRSGRSSRKNTKGD